MNRYTGRSELRTGAFFSADSLCLLWKREFPLQNTEWKAPAFNKGGTAIYIVPSAKEGAFFIENVYILRLPCLA
ncbi:hypothetical protein D7Z54_06795 [Salibacterium salarium]|uniref:Uncharacterized protein n=1 Tax=Salibacterium salarium TaxID=284579 RepID=A0A428N7B0_9BACI|nr:hypothetical protein D7Z54_06795 [Salibacterium salarium]